MKNALLCLLFPLFVQNALGQAAPPTILVHSGNGTRVIVYEDQDIRYAEEYVNGKIAKADYIVQGRLAESYAMEEFKFMRALGSGDGCQDRFFETQMQMPNLIVAKGKLITFFSGKPDPNMSFYHGSLQTCTIGNGRNVTVPAWGMSGGLTLPDGSEITFTPYYYNGCSGTSYGAAQLRVGKVTLGADFQIPALGLVKKGQKISFKEKYANNTPLLCNDSNGGSWVLE